MAILWGGRFTKDNDKEMFDFNESLSFDKRLYKVDITGSLAHAEMLGKQGIISIEEAEDITKGLKSILEDIESGSLKIDSAAEDIHSFVEAELIKRIGDTGKKLHTGRSRNDQVALDMKLYTREQIDSISLLLKDFIDVIIYKMEENTDTYMPAFTHLQKAQPTNLAHYLGAYVEMFLRDKDRLKDIRKRMNLSPLGAGALCGTTYNLDRDFVAEKLGFDTATFNSMDSVSDRDYLIETLSALSIIMMHLSRFSEEIIIWNSNEYRFVEIDDAYSTGSSIMPQKKNPDVAELVRGKTGRTYGALISLLTTMKGLPLAYNKDMQEDKEVAFDAMDTVSKCISIFTKMLYTLKFNNDVLAESAMKGYTNATDAADYLVKKGMPFRDAHSVIGRLVLLCLEKDCAIEDLSVSELKELSELFDEDVYDAISLKTCVERRMTKGAPGEIKKAIEHYKDLNK
ncbi:argininosuccinate lyase [Lachnospiraceae bacterium G41]|nr:argininosuccinate lyase [Lachnospiraceae bacterium G41]